MKSQHKLFFPIALLAALLLVAPASAKSVKVTMTLDDNRAITGFVIKGNATTLIVASTPTAPNGQPIARNKIVNIYWDEPDDWKAAMKLWTRRDYSAAAKAFEDVAKT